MCKWVLAHYPRYSSLKMYLVPHRTRQIYPMANHLITKNIYMHIDVDKWWLVYSWEN